MLIEQISPSFIQIIYLLKYQYFSGQSPRIMMQFFPSRRDFKFDHSGNWALRFATSHK